MASGDVDSQPVSNMKDTTSSDSSTLTMSSSLIHSSPPVKVEVAGDIDQSLPPLDPPPPHPVNGHGDGDVPKAEDSCDSSKPSEEEGDMKTVTIEMDESSQEEASFLDKPSESTKEETEEVEEVDYVDEEDDEVEVEPLFATICSFFLQFNDKLDLGVTYSMEDLKVMLEDHDHVHEELVDLHVKLLRKRKRWINKEKWEKTLVKFVSEYNHIHAYDMERFGYRLVKTSVRLELLLRLLESQFDFNPKFKQDINTLESSALRLVPIGRDINGYQYWYQRDFDNNLRVYKEVSKIDDSWQCVVKNREELTQLIEHLTTNTILGPIDPKLIGTLPQLLPLPEEQEDVKSELNHQQELGKGQVPLSPKSESPLIKPEDNQQFDHHKVDSIKIKKEQNGQLSITPETPTDDNKLEQNHEEKAETSPIEVKSEDDTSHHPSKDASSPPQVPGMSVTDEVTDVSPPREESVVREVCETLISKTLESVDDSPVKGKGSTPSRGRKGRKGKGRGKAASSTTTSATKSTTPSTPKAATTTPTTTNRSRSKGYLSRELTGLNGLSEQDVPKMEENGSPPRVRQSRRIAQLTVKKIAEMEVKAKLEQEAVAKKLAKKKEREEKLLEFQQRMAKKRAQPDSDDGSDYDHKNEEDQQEEEEEEEEADNSSDEDFEGTKGKKGKKGGKGKKGAKGGKKGAHSHGKGKGKGKWDHSSEDDMFAEEEDDEDEGPLIFDDDDEDEFACEDLDPIDGEPVILRKARTAKKTKSDNSTSHPKEDDAYCKRCNKGHDPEWILLCDKCDSGFHTQCLIPSLYLIPDGDWFCPPCENTMLLDKLSAELGVLDDILKAQVDNQDFPSKNRLQKFNVEQPGDGDAPLEEDGYNHDYEEDDEDEEEEKMPKKKRKKFEDDDDVDFDSGGDHDGHKVAHKKRPPKPKIPKVKPKPKPRRRYESDSDVSDEPESEVEEDLTGRPRKRKTVNYQFTEYDELINSAIRVEDEYVTDGAAITTTTTTSAPLAYEDDDPEEVEPEYDEDESEEEFDENGQKIQRRGKDIATIENAIRAASASASEGGITQDPITTTSSEEVATTTGPTDPESQQESREGSVDKDDKSGETKSNNKKASTKKRKLNDLDSPAEDDDSDESFKGGSDTEVDAEGSEGFDPTDSDATEDNDSDESDFEQYRKKDRSKKVSRVSARKTKGRSRRYADYDSDDDEESDEDYGKKKSKKQSSKNNKRKSYKESTTEEEDETEEEWASDMSDGPKSKKSAKKDKKDSGDEDSDVSWGGRGTGKSSSKSKAKSSKKVKSGSDESEDESNEDESDDASTEGSESDSDKKVKSKGDASSADSKKNPKKTTVLKQTSATARPRIKEPIAPIIPDEINAENSENNAILPPEGDKLDKKMEVDGDGVKPTDEDEDQKLRSNDVKGLEITINDGVKMDESHSKKKTPTKKVPKPKPEPLAPRERIGRYAKSQIVNLTEFDSDEEGKPKRTRKKKEEPTAPMNEVKLEQPLAGKSVDEKTEKDGVAEGGGVGVDGKVDYNPDSSDIKDMQVVKESPLIAAALTGKHKKSKSKESADLKPSKSSSSNDKDGALSALAAFASRGPDPKEVAPTHRPPPAHPQHPPHSLPPPPHPPHPSTHGHLLHYDMYPPMAHNPMSPWPPEPAPAESYTLTSLDSYPRPKPMKTAMTEVGPYEAGGVGGGESPPRLLSLDSPSASNFPRHPFDARYAHAAPFDPKNPASRLPHPYRPPGEYRGPPLPGHALPPHGYPPHPNSHLYSAHPSSAGPPGSYPPPPPPGGAPPHPMDPYHPMYRPPHPSHPFFYYR